MKIRITLMAAVFALGATLHVSAADHKTGAMDPAMEKAMKLSQPGGAHQVLASFAGKWNTSVKTWMKPGTPPMESKGTSEITVLNGGRFLKQEFKGDFGGQAYAGTGITGYDNIRGEYQSIWFDNMSTGMMIATGQYDPAKKVLAFSGTASCPMTGEKNMWSRSEWTMNGTDTSTYTSWTKGPDGKEVKSMEIVSTRVK